MPPNTTVWELQPHTTGKHRVLRRYMQAWLAILGQRKEQILFVDGFAGPGAYKNGEPGSPLVALSALKSLEDNANLSASIDFLFIEKQTDRAQHLKDTLDDAYPTPPFDCSLTVVEDSFDNVMNQLLADVGDTKESMPPAFVMIDPFGVEGIHMSTLSKLLRNESTEVYVSFMYEAMNRWMSTPAFRPHLTALFGCETWTDALEIKDQDERKRFLFDLYRRQLKNAGASQVVHFELYEQNRLVYAIFFGTNHLLGCDRMKEAIWTVTDSQYKFRGQHADQASLDLDTVDFTDLRLDLRSRFGLRDSVTIEEVEDYMMSDDTMFHKGHLRQKTLQPMERDGEVQVLKSPRKNNFGHPKGTVLRFAPL